LPYLLDNDALLEERAFGSMVINLEVLHFMEYSAHMSIMRTLILQRFLAEKLRSVFEVFLANDQYHM
jgi:hypothetical protein